MKIRNKHIYSTDQDYLVWLQGEYQFLGKDTVLTPGCLTLLTTKPKQARARHAGKKKRR